MEYVVRFWENVWFGVVTVYSEQHSQERFELFMILALSRSAT